jgi:hypothetical protein
MARADGGAAAASNEIGLRWACVIGCAIAGAYFEHRPLRDIRDIHENGARAPAHTRRGAAMETPQLHHYGHMPLLLRSIAHAVTPRFSRASKPSKDQIADATRGQSIWRLIGLLIRDRLPRRTH